VFIQCLNTNQNKPVQQKPLILLGLWETEAGEEGDGDSEKLKGGRGDNLSVSGVVKLGKYGK